MAAAVGSSAAPGAALGFWEKYRSNWRLYSTIPVVAGLLNWATNLLAVKMIFYPMNFVGVRLRTWPETPLGLVGWTGIVPSKARPMATRMVSHARPRCTLTAFSQPLPRGPSLTPPQCTARDPSDVTANDCEAPP